MVIRNFLFLFMLMCGMWVTLVAQENRALVVSSNGVSSSFSIKDVRSIKYSNDKMNISLIDGSSVGWDISSIGSLSFGVAPSTAVGKMEFSKVQFKGASLFVEASQGSNLRVYDSRGRLVYSKIMPSEHLHVDVCDWGKGMYIINIGGTIIKLLNR